MAVNQLSEYIKTHLLKGGNLNQGALAKELGVSRATLNGLLNGKKKLSEVMALRLSSFTGEPPGFWFSLEKDNAASSDHSAGKAMHSETKMVMQQWKGTGQHTLVDWEIEIAIRNQILGVQPLLENSIQPASLDLSVGNAIISGEEDNNADLRDEPLIMHPDATAVVQTAETLSLPNCLLGRLGCMSTLAQSGIMTIHGHHVDPGFKGHLYVTLKNIGKRDFYLMYGKKFLTLEIIYLPVNPKSTYDGPNLERENFLKNERETIGIRDTMDEVNEIVR